MRVSAEMLSVSPDGTIPPFPNRLRIYREDGRGKAGLVFVEIEAIHDGHKVVNTVVVELGVFRYHLTSSGLLSP